LIDFDLEFVLAHVLEHNCYFVNVKK